MDGLEVLHRAVDRNFVSRLAVEVAVTVGVFDRILAGAAGIHELATACEVDPHALDRLLRVLQARGLVIITGDLIAITDAGRLLTRSGPFSWRARLDLEGMGRRMDEAVFHGLLSSIRSGQAAYEEVHGLPFWQDVREHGLASSFQAHMQPHIAEIAPEVASLAEVAEASSVLDVCGGDGALLQAVLDRHPHLRGTVLELPENAALATARFAASQLATRAAVLPGDVFLTVPPAHDVSLLCWVLHDWTDEEAARILRTGATAVAPRGTVIVIERIRDDSLALLESDLRMLVFFGGRERSRSEWLELFGEAGLALARQVALGASGFVAFCLEHTPTAGRHGPW